MNRLLHLAILSVALLFINITYANDEPVLFSDKDQEQRYQTLIEEIRCLVCQNQSLADSNAELAQDLRSEVYEMIVSGKQDDEIHQFLVERYGDFVLYRPPLKDNTLLLWFGPFLLLIIAVIITIIIIKKQSSNKTFKNDISEEEQKRLAEILNKNTARKDQS